MLPKRRAAGAIYGAFCPALDASLPLYRAIFGAFFQAGRAARFPFTSSDIFQV
jgi:hypothetical protein